MAEPGTDAVAERLFRTFKEHLDHGRVFRTIDAVREALRAFAARTNAAWPIGKNRCLGPRDAHAAQAIACGADVVQVTSALLAHGPDRIGAIVTGLRATLDKAGYTAADGPRGILNLDHAPGPTAWTRLNHVRTLDG
jgi:hypothetical protein